MSDIVQQYIRSLGANGESLNKLHKRFSFLCNYFSVPNPGPTKKKIKLIFKNLALKLQNCEPINRDSFVVACLSSYEQKNKYDTNHIAFCRSREFYQSQRWKNARLKVLAQRNYCSSCGMGPNQGKVLHVDHVLPRSVYPELALELTNLQILCQECNEGKGNTIYKKFK